MRVRVRLVRPFRDAVGQPAVEFEPRDARLLPALGELCARYPELREHLLQGEQLSAYVNVYRNGAPILAEEMPRAALADGDELLFLLPLTGG